MKKMFTLCFAILAIGISHAQIFVSQLATGSNDGTSWANAFTDIQDALDSSEQGDQLWIAAGTYLPSGTTPESSHFWVFNPLEIYGGFVGTESNLNERDWANNLTILSGDINGDDLEGDFFSLREDNAHHVVIIDAGDHQTILDGLIFRGGTTRMDSYFPDATDDYINRWNGGALYVYKSPVIIRNSTFMDNSGSRGAGVFALGDYPLDSKFTIEKTLFKSNYTNIQGGGMQISNWKSPSIHKCTFQGNETVYGGGGIIVGNSNAVISECGFSKNISTYGGGISVFHNTLSIIDKVSVTVSKCTFDKNVAAQEGGGFIFNNADRSFHLTLDSCTFTNCITTNPYFPGGGLSINDLQDLYQGESASSVRIKHCIVEENHSGMGGGAWISAKDDSLNVQITKSIFSGNEANTHGGGLYIGIYDLGILHLQLDTTTFENNSALYGGGGFGFLINNNIFRPVFVIDSCLFNNNIAGSWGGAIGSTLDDGFGSIGSIVNSQFLSNQSIGEAGAIDSYLESLLIENCLFSENYTEGTFDPPFNGGGAIAFDSPDSLIVRNTIFKGNESYAEGAALIVNGETNALFENVLFHENMGTNALASRAKIFLFNSTMTGNEKGLFLRDSSTIEIQNSIFNNVSDNLKVDGSANVLSNGGNISSDNSMIAYLHGNGSYEDLHQTDPMLGQDNIPVTGSPCIDAGNPEGIDFALDLAGNPRYYGNAIDIGAYESFLVAVKDAVWDAPGLAVYPNPAIGILNFTLESGWTGDISLAIYNYLGQPVYRSKRVKSGNVESYSEEINQLTAGEYVLLVNAGNMTYAVNVIIQR